MESSRASQRTDWAGVVHPAAPAPRIASLVPSLTELLFALGLGESVVARTGFCVHPKPEVARVPKVGGTKDPDPARLAKLAPTHLIVNVDENRREVVDAARAFVPHVIVTHPLAPTDNPRLYRLFGAIFDRVMRPRPSPLERSRRRDGHLYGGTQPTDISMIDRRCYRPRLFRWLEPNS